jgi:hypothetical protein
LRVFSRAYVDALAAHNRENVRRQKERPGDFDWIFEPDRAVLRAWMPKVEWPLGAAHVPVEASEYRRCCLGPRGTRPWSNAVLLVGSWLQSLGYGRTSRPVAVRDRASARTTRRRVTLPHAE